jgi:hypothetical protein
MVHGPWSVVEDSRLWPVTGHPDSRLEFSGSSVALLVLRRLKSRFPEHIFSLSFLSDTRPKKPAFIPYRLAHVHFTAAHNNDIAERPETHTEYTA